ncbi:MAG: VapC toxin family PIN domain ribonuclease [Actinomycetota bacterium]|nr:VapC toxin family PIN domain ribonuclease [Actinomycetota bacterium]
MTENGFVRILSQPRYPSPVSCSAAVELLSRAYDSNHHEFWPCDVSVLDRHTVDRSRLHSPRQVTDAYLLALAVAHGGRFVTFDRGLALSAVYGATEHHLTIL